MKVQVAFQGGGARFVDMLPVVAAFKRFDPNDLKITRVAGTSSGSICAALLCQPGSVENLRAFAKTNGQKLLRDTSSVLYSGFDGLGWFQRLKLASNALKGEPIVAPEKFRAFVKTILREYGCDLHSIAQINSDPSRPVLSIMAADLENEVGHTISEGDLHDAIIRSCAFPFAIKNFRQVLEDPYVDGGLTDNLPSEDLLEPHENGLKILVCPEANGAGDLPRNILSFGARLLSTSINHQVTKEKKAIRDGIVVPVDTEIEIHQIKQALEFLSDDNWFEAKVQKYTEKLSEILHMQPSDDSEGTILSTALPVSYYKRELYKVHHRIFAQDKYEVRRLSHIVVAHSLEGGPKGKLSRADRIEREVEIEVGPEGLVCFRSRAPLKDEWQVPTMWVVKKKGENGQFENVDVTPFPVEVPEDEHEMPGSNLLFFNDYSPKDLAGSTLRIKSIYNISGAMSPLREEGRDFIRVKHNYASVAALGEVMLCVPASFGVCKAALGNNKNGVAEFELLDEAPSDRQIAKPGGFKVVGGVTTNWKPRTFFELDFTREGK